MSYTSSTLNVYAEHNKEQLSHSRVMASKQKATVTKLASDSQTASRKMAKTSDRTDADCLSNDVLQKIQKMFRKAQHENANESEAHAAALLASRMMARFNVTEAQIMQHESNEERKERGGISLVVVTPPKKWKRAIFQTWTSDLRVAICTFFECRAFSTQKTHEIEWTFYGIAENTCSGAMAFAMVHNLALVWADKYSSVAKRNSYCNGIMLGLSRIAEEESAEVERKARNKEQRAMAAKIREEELRREKEIHRLRNPEPAKETPSPSMGRSAAFSPSSPLAVIKEESILVPGAHPDSPPPMKVENPKVTPPGLPPISHEDYNLQYNTSSGASSVDESDGDIEMNLSATCEDENDRSKISFKEDRALGNDDIDLDNIPDYEGPTFVEDDAQALTAILTGDTNTDLENIAHAQKMAQLKTEVDEDELEAATDLDLQGESSKVAKSQFTPEDPLTPIQIIETEVANHTPAATAPPTPSQTAAPSLARLETAVKAEQKKHDLSEDEISSEWASMQQLTVFREAADVIAKEVLRSHSIELVNSKKRKRSIKDSEAYWQGWEDSKKINVRVITIEDTKDSEGS